MNFLKNHQQELHDCINKQKSHNNNSKKLDDVNYTNKILIKKSEKYINNRSNYDSHLSEEHTSKSNQKNVNRDLSRYIKDKKAYRKNSPNLENFLKKIEQQNKKYITKQNSNKTIQKVIEYQYKIAELKDYVFERNWSKNDSKKSYKSSQDSSLASLKDVQIYNLNSQNWKNSIFVEKFITENIDKNNSRSDKGYLSASVKKKRSHNSSKRSHNSLKKNSFVNKSSNKNSYCSKSQRKKIIATPSVTLSLDSKENSQKKISNSL